MFLLYIHQNTDTLSAIKTTSMPESIDWEVICTNITCVHLNPEIRKPIADTQTKVELEHPVREGTKSLSLKKAVKNVFF